MSNDYMQNGLGAITAFPFAGKTRQPIKYDKLFANLQWTNA
jgi:hypothetical protein